MMPPLSMMPAETATSIVLSPTRLAHIHHKFLFRSESTIIERGHLQDHLALFKSLPDQFCITRSHNYLAALMVHLHLDPVTVWRRA
jgi:hypothetical protein